MADTSSIFKSGSAPVGAGEGAPAGSTVTTSAPAAGGSINAIMKGTEIASNLSAEGKEYLDKILSTVQGAGFTDAKQIRVSGAGYEAYVIQAQGRSYAFVMLETRIMPSDGLPAAACIDNFRSELQAHAGIDPNTLDQFIVVPKSYYEKGDIMASFIANCVKAGSDSVVKHMSIDAFRNQVFKVTTDEERVTSFIRSCWPVDVLPRHDVGFLIYGQEPIQGQRGPDGKQAFETIPIVAVTGYTEFVYAKAGSMYAAELRHAPIFVITGVYSRLPSSRLTALAITASASVFITNGQWLAPYSQYVKGAPDIGNLARDENGKLYSVQDIIGRNNIINNYLAQKVPLLALDVQLGMPLMPGLKDIFSNPAKFNAEIDSFTGGKGASSARGIVQTVRRRFDGTCKITRAGVAEDVDTRTIDPLYLIANGVDAGDCADLYRLFLDADPNADAAKRSEIVKRFVPNTQLRYITSRTLIEPEWVCNVTGDLNKTIMLDIDTAFAETTYDVSSLRGFQLESIGAMPMFQSGMTPVGLWGGSNQFGF